MVRGAMAKDGGWVQRAIVWVDVRTCVCQRTGTGLGPQAGWLREKPTSGFRQLLGALNTAKRSRTRTRALPRFQTKPCRYSAHIRHGYAGACAPVRQWVT